MKVIELKDVKKSYGKNEILHGISLMNRIKDRSWSVEKKFSRIQM